MRRVDALSDEQSDAAAEQASGSTDPPSSEDLGADRTSAARAFIQALSTACGCNEHRRRRGGNGERVAQNCLDRLKQPLLLERAIDHRLHWLRLHKLDQDRLLFTELRDQCRQQNLAGCPEAAGGLGDPEAGPQGRGRLVYHLLGSPVCKEAVMRFWGVGSRRFRALRKAVLAGQGAPPVDLSYFRRAHSRDADKHKWIVSYLETLYESEAETLPDNLDDVEID